MFDMRTDTAALLAAIGVCCLVAIGGCGGASTDAGAGADTRRSELDEALRDLAEHRVRRARRTYASLLENGDASGEAAAGKALTDLMLLPSSDPADTLLIDHLGAAGELDAVAVIYAEQGYLYWLSRGVRWESNARYAGIKSLVADRLPWSLEQIDSTTTFVEGRTQKVEAATDAMVALADRMKRIQEAIDTVLEDREFERFVLPGEALQEDELDIELRSSEFALLGAAVAAARAGLYAFSAYVHDWTLQRAFGEHWEKRADSDSGEHPNWSAFDYTLDYLDGELGRELHEAHEARLQSAQRALDTSLAYLETSIRRGLERSSDDDGMLEWSSVDTTYARELRTCLAAVRDSLQGATDIPCLDPTTRLDLSVLFDDGRTLDADIDWGVPRKTSTTGRERDGDEIRIDWRWNDRALQRFFVDGVFAPSFDVGEDDGPELTVGGQQWERFSEQLTESLRRRIDNAFFQSR